MLSNREGGGVVVVMGVRGEVEIRGLKRLDGIDGLERFDMHFCNIHFQYTSPYNMKYI